MLTAFFTIVVVKSCGVKTIIIPEELLLESNLIGNQYFKNLLLTIKGEFEKGKSIIVNSTRLSNQNDNHFTNHNHGLISQRIGVLIAAIIHEVKIKTLVVSGGDTLLEIMREISCTSIVPKTEIFPGVALSLAEGNNVPLRLVTKPGGYGEVDVLIQLINKVK